ncbi:MAG: DEAD/DEAH box helicase [Kiritimatiellia bacterium]
MSFSLFSFNPAIVANLATMGYSVPTPIQRDSIGPILSGRDVMGLAQTGTGKTAAYALPVLQRLLSGPRRRTRALVVAPTRELAEQIHEVFVKLGRGTGLRFAAIYGGASMGPQFTNLRAGVEVVIACPGRLLDHVNRGSCRLDCVETVVLDEADRMFDMGFLPDIRKILSKLPASRQALLFSATMPADIRKLANESLHNPLTVQVENALPPATVSHALYPVSQALKTGLLLKLLTQIDRESVLVFARTKHRAEKLSKVLAAAGHKTTSLQGNLSQNRRREAMEGFRGGTYHIMVATDIASRGIDVSTISHVINYDVPATVDDYIHRIGRTGRAAKTGDAFTLVTREDEGLVRAIENRLQTRLVRHTIPDFNYRGANDQGETPRFKPKPVVPRLDGTPRPASATYRSSRFHRSGPPRRRPA